MYASEFLNKLESDASDEKSLKMKATVGGGLTGMLFGLYYGYSKRQNMVITGFVGAVAGAIIARVMLPK